MQTSIGSVLNSFYDVLHLGIAYVSDTFITNIIYIIIINNINCSVLIF
jgi:hypothetical protein